MKNNTAVTLAAAAILSIFSASGCIYRVPVTAEPTRNIDERLLGEWLSKDGKNKLKVRRLDDAYCIVSLNGLLFRAYHSDVAGIPFASVQEIETPDRKYTYVMWALSEDGERLKWRAISRKVVPDDIDSPAAVQTLLENNVKNAALYEDEQEYIRETQKKGGRSD